MKSINIKNLVLQFDGNQVTSGTPFQQAQQALDLINGVLQRQPYGLGAQVMVTALDKSDVEVQGEELRKADIERLVEAAKKLNLTAENVAGMFGIEGDRLNNGGLAEVFGLILEEDDVDWVHERLETSGTEI